MSKYLQPYVASKSVRSASLHNRLPLERHAYALPFFPVYGLWLYVYWYHYDRVLGSSELTTFSFLVVAALNILVLLSCQWSVSAKAFLTCTKATDPFQAHLIKIIPIEHNGPGELTELKKRVIEYKDSTKTQLYFIFQKRKFIYNPETRMFEKVKYPSKMGYSMDYFKQWQGLQEEQEHVSAQDLFGSNRFDIPIPSFQELFKEQAVAPFFVFQLFCVSLWFLDEMWYYSIFTVVMLVVFESTVVFQRLRNLQEFRSMSTKPYPIYVYRLKKWVKVQTDELLPGDVVSVTRTKEEGEAQVVAADMLLLQGSCIANEAMLSGESTPQLKESVALRENHEVFHIENDKGSVLFGGTKILQVTPPKYEQAETKDDSVHIPNAPDNGCIATVLRTGFSTQQGKLVRMIIFSTERVTANNMESFLFILFLLFFALIAAGYVWNEGMNNPNRKRSKVLLDCILIITSVVPPELPMELSLAVNNSLIALARGYVFCTEPFRIPFAGKIDVACFDKTGTITEEDLIVQGVTGISATASLDELKKPMDIPRETTMVLAAAHALVYLDEPQEEESSSEEKSSQSSSETVSKPTPPKPSIIGDPMEKNTLDAIQWTLLKGDIVVPKKSQKSTQLRILRRFAFSSALKRMSTISAFTDKGQLELFVAVKGAPETIQTMLSTVPDYYEDVYKHWARKGSRVLALAYKWLENVKIPQVHDVSRDSVESDLIFAGFLVFSCPLKPDSAQAIISLNESSHRVIMITGDNPLTAVHVAKQVEIVKRNVLIADVWHEKEGLVLKTVDENKTFTLDPQSHVPSNKEIFDYDLCITGRGLDLVMNTPAWSGYLLPRLWVYARVSPSQKEYILTSLKQAGYCTLMCGDGTNDVGALKQSHVGIALLDGKQEDLEKLAARLRIRRQQQMMEQQAKLRERWGLDKLEKEAQGTNTIVDQKAAARRKAEEQMKEKLNAMLSDMGDEPPSIKFGDASVAAPFTSKLASLKSVTQIVRQGRSTLVAMIQMYKILALNCLISAYSMSVMYLAGIKQGDWQATIAGLLITMCFFGIAKSSTVDKLSKKRPQANVFNFYLVLSVLGQAAVHVGSLAYIRQEAIKFSEELQVEEEINLDAEFQPNILNSGVYLVTLIMQISTFAINYQGAPFRESLRENKALWNSLVMTSAIAVLAATEFSSDLNNWMQLVPFPDEFRHKLIMTMVLDFGVAWLIEQIASRLFSDNKPKSSLLLN